MANDDKMKKTIQQEMKEYPKLFAEQPAITRKVIANLQRRGLLTAPVSLHDSERRVALVSNPTSGDVVGYVQLSNKLKERAISQDDARALLSIEAAREKGPRKTHIQRLMPRVFVEEKAEALRKVQEHARATRHEQEIMKGS